MERQFMVIDINSRRIVSVEKSPTVTWENEGKDMVLTLADNLYQKLIHKDLDYYQQVRIMNSITDAIDIADE